MRDSGGLKGAALDRPLNYQRAVEAMDTVVEVGVLRGGVPLAMKVRLQKPGEWR